MDTSAYRQSVEAWREKMDASLRAEDGWLALAGLFWLNEGSNPFGAAPESDIALPPNSIPAHVGSFEFHDGNTTLRVGDGQIVTVNGERAFTMPLRSDAEGSPSVVTVNDVSMIVIKRGDRYGIRVRDKNNPARKAFTGRTWYPIDETYRIEARFIPFEPARMMMNTNILGFEEQQVSPGYVEFTLGDRSGQLQAFGTSSGRLWFVFRDATSGDTTYGAARFLYADAPQDGAVVLDFNQAYNPPCAFTTYATCPLPPRENRLSLRIEAGELARVQT